MARKSPTRPEPRRAAAAPPADEALLALARRTLRAIVFLFVRFVGVALLVSVLAVRLPGIAANRTLVDALAALLVVLPFFTALGRNFAWRIALGRAYVGEARWIEAERALGSFDRKRGYHPFDAAGEGVYWLAVTRRATGREDEAARLFDLVARQGRDPWRAQAATQQARRGAPAAAPPAGPN